MSSILTYLGFTINNNTLKISILNGDHQFHETVPLGTNSLSTFSGWIRYFSKINKLKIVAAAYPDQKAYQHFASPLWRHLDISPFPAKGIRDPLGLASYAKSQFNDDASYTAKVNKNQSVQIITLTDLNDYESVTPPDQFQKILSLAKNFKPKKLIFISATPQGGGVALMRHALIRFYKHLGVDANWYVLKEEPKIFDITKTKFHNILQSVLDTDINLTQSEMSQFDDWSAKNYQLLKTPIKNSDIIVIDDPQPSGLIPHIREHYPKKPIIYRSHIQLVARLANQKHTSQNITWEFIWDKIKSSNLFISHPNPDFVPREIPKSRLAYMGATTDRFDGLNKELSDFHKAYYLEEFNQMLAQAHQKPLDLVRPYIIQIARFDPSKGIGDLLESYRLMAKKCTKQNIDPPQLIIVGNTSVDDPDGIPVYNAIMKMVKSKPFTKLKNDIKVLRLPHYDQLLNTLLRDSTIALQLSYKEGFEIKITEALMKGKPVIIYDNGGMPLQIKHETTGFIAKSGDKKDVANYLYQLLTNKKLYRRLSMNARNLFNEDANTISNAHYWLYLANKLLKNPNYHPSAKHLSQLV